MGTLTGNGFMVIGAVLIVLLLLCAAVGVNAWFRVRRIDRAEAERAAERAAETRTPEPAAPAPPPDDLPEDPDYQGPGDWDGGPADPPEYREDR